MASTTKKAAVEYDFDSWTEDDEAKAIAAIAPDVKYIIVERTFVGRFYDGTIVKASLALTLDDVDALQAEYANEVDQFRSLIRVMGGEENVRALSRQDISDVVHMATKYFDVLGRIQGATRPE
ncbi:MULTISPECIES: hypothetical protein [Bacteria]|uniref:ATP-dependent serine Clp protease n=1 Tax=Microbacterium phage Min1 TaxID=446529 RepID=A6N206_9CAUD|nr:tail assembly chaperone [Microbacterium phage Min1]ABR10478.1 ATP-dependent serine Clp protease [Microbacterium phage Min1]